MISDQSNFRVQIRRLFVIMIRSSYQWICNHPFRLGFVGFLYLMHRTCPLLFSPLVTASPVLVCTFVLLGTILSFGEPNIPEIEKEPETVHETALFRTEVSRDATVVEKGNKSFTVENFLSKEKDVLEDGDRLRENQLSEAEDDGRSFDYRPLVDETLGEMKRDTQVKFEEKVFVLELEKRGERVDGKLIDNGGMQVLGAEHLRKIGGSLDELMDASKDDQMDVSPISPWRPMRHGEDEDDDADRDDSLDSGSDGAESSSPDASMTDIIPMLDELHPLLHSQAPSRGFADDEGSDAASEGPHRSSSDEGMESDVDSENHGEEGDNENEEEEEKKNEGKDDESKSAIKWTEADQKNVMDLGSLELERNQRLENLIARRTARPNMRLMTEKNLIDLDSADIPFNMPSISTARQNPCDLAYDMYDDMAIPGSAPSIMFSRRNPFDLPYEPNEEKPDLKGDGFQEEFISQQPKDPVFRRHESFSVGPSMLGGHRHDRIRPFFVLERLANEGTSYYPLERQLSEVSESKVSSVPDTESVCTVMEDDEKKVDEHDTDREAGITKEKNLLVADHDEEKSHSASDHDEEKSQSASDNDEEKSHSTSDHDEDKSHSSEDSDFVEQADSKNRHHDVAKIILGNAETHHEQSNAMVGETSDKGNLDEEDYSDSDSCLSEIEEKIPDISENVAMLISEQKVSLHDESSTSSEPSFGGIEIHGARGMQDDYHHDEARVEDSFISAHPSLDESATHELCGLVEGHHEEPVYDSSPPSGSRFPSFSSISSDYKPDLPGNNGEDDPRLEQDPVQSSNRAGLVSVVFSRNITFHEYHDAPGDTVELSELTSDSSSSPAESPEYTTPMVGEGSRTEFFQEDVYEELDNVVERLDQLSDLHAMSQSPHDFMTEEADMMEDIDEGLLFELDTVGDFSVNEVATDFELGPASIEADTANETEALHVLEARSAEDIDSAFQHIHEGSEVEDVILPSTVQDQLAEDNYKNSTETKSDLAVEEATSKEYLYNAMNQAVVESMDKQSKSPESDGESGEIKGAVETEPSDSSIEEKSLEETNVPLNNTPEKEETEEEEESKQKEITTSDVLAVETQPLEEVPKPAEPNHWRKTMEAISEKLLVPTEANGCSNVTLSDEVFIEEAKAETASNANDATVKSLASKEISETSGESIAEEKGKMEKD